MERHRTITTARERDAGTNGYGEHAGSTVANDYTLLRDRSASAIPPHLFFLSWIVLFHEWGSIETPRFRTLSGV